MDVKLGRLVLRDVQIPLLWGTRVIYQDPRGCLTVVDLSQSKIKIEIIGDKPVAGLAIVQTGDGFAVLSDGRPLYHYDPEHKTLTSIGLGLPNCQIDLQFVRVGTHTFGANTICGVRAGVIVSKELIGLGAHIPPQLAPLVA